LPAPPPAKKASAGFTPSPPCDVALQFRLPRNRDGYYRLSGIEFRVEFGEVLALERHGGLLLAPARIAPR